MDKHKGLWRIGLGVALAIAIVILGVYATRDKRDDVYQDMLIAYLDAMKIGTEEAVQYASFPNDDIREAFLSSPVHIIDYEIENAETINKSLRAYTILIEDSMNMGVYRRIYYFVGELDRQYTVFGNVKFIPESLRENLDASQYSYVDKDILGTPEFSS